MNAAVFQNMAPSAQRSFLLTAGIAALVVLIYLFGIQPCQTSISKAAAELGGLRDQQTSVDRDLAAAKRIQGELGQIQAARAPYLKGLLTPLLESYAMRAKSVLDPFAADAGVLDADYGELPVRALPLPPKIVPHQLYARQPIRVSCRGSYAEIVSFVLRVERDLPLVSVGGLTITSQADPEMQKAEIILEWPVLGALSTPVPAAGGAR